ncbi:MAG: ComF family protein [Flavobacteriales bacterium]|nr:ComF family protein [Flavobacteriales bacterium]
MNFILSKLSDFLALLYPITCAGCNQLLFRNESVICTFCKHDLPKTNFHNDINNDVCKLFWGRVNIECATSFFFFNKKGKVQNMIHGLKYHSNQDLGTTLGKLFGYELKKSEHFKSIDVVIPVPLHKKKMAKRGYNQSEVIAVGISEAMEIPHNINTLIRVGDGETQTNKSKYDRWTNIENAFFITDNLTLKGKHVLLVDDVVTTGSTLTSCAEKLLEIEGTKVSVATLACA